MKRFLVLLIVAVFFITGCTDVNNTPSRKVEEYIGKYQTMDSSVLAQLKNIIDSDLTMSEDQKKDYQALMEKQYQNLTYKIKDEDIDGNNATVIVEIEVLNYKNSLNNSEEYLDEHEEEFYGDNKKVDTSKFMDYKLSKLKDVTERENYTITFYLTKTDDTWKIDDLSNNDIKKIHGLYED